jgi:GNAT superfamily N-acetyltransferase
VRELAEYERALDEVRLEQADVVAALFCEHPAAFCHVVEAEGEVVGLALWYLTFSTWVGRHGIYLEDLYVRPDHRRDGHGTALLATLARLCVERGYGRLEWAVLDWNTPALEFYRSLGARPLDDWTVHRLSGDALAGLAGTAGGR